MIVSYVDYDNDSVKW